MWWLIPAGLTAAILVPVGYVLAHIGRRNGSGSEGMMAAFLILAAAAISLVWGAYFAIEAVLG